MNDKDNKDLQRMQDTLAKFGSAHQDIAEVFVGSCMKHGLETLEGYDGKNAESLRADCKAISEATENAKHQMEQYLAESEQREAMSRVTQASRGRGK